MIEITWQSGKKDYIKVKNCPNCDYWHLKARAYIDICEKLRKHCVTHAIIHSVSAMIILYLFLRG